MPFPFPHALLASIVVAAGALVQGSIGFGAGVLAAPLLLLIDAHLVPGPVLLSGFVLTALVALRERATVDVRGVAWALVGRLPGTALGVFALLWVPARELATLCGVLMLIGVALSASRIRIDTTRTNLIGAGIASGVMGTMTSMGGPSIALMYQHAEGPKLRGTMSVYFLFSGAMSLIGLVSAGLFGERELMATLPLLPGVLVGFFASRWTRTRLDAGGTRTAVLALAGFAAASVLVKQWW